MDSEPVGAYGEATALRSLLCERDPALRGGRALWVEGGKSTQKEPPADAPVLRAAGPQECCLLSWLRVLFALSAGKLRVNSIVTPSLNYVTFLSALCRPPMDCVFFLVNNLRLLLEADGQ